MGRRRLPFRIFEEPDVRAEAFDVDTAGLAQRIRAGASVTAK